MTFAKRRKKADALRASFFRIGCGSSITFNAVVMGVAYLRSLFGAGVLRELSLAHNVALLSCLLSLTAAGARPGSPFDRPRTCAKLLEAALAFAAVFNGAMLAAIVGVDVERRGGPAGLERALVACVAVNGAATAVVHRASGLDVSVVSLPNHAIGNPGAAALSTLLLEEPATGYAGALTRLDLRGNAVGAVGVQAIADAVRKSTAIVDLDLSWNPLGEEGGYRVAEMLESLETLKALKVAHTDLDTSALIAICSTLRTNGACLEHLDVGGAVLAAEQSEDFAKHVATMLGLNRRLLSLSLGNCRIGDDSVGHIATALQGNPTLTALNLKANRVRSAGAAALADALRRSARSAGNRRGPLAPPLKILDLSHNAIGDEGAAALADAVAHECSLYELRVAHNDIDDAGLADLARALHHPNHLRYVAAWGNRFGKSANAEFHDLYHGDNDCYVEMDFTTYEVDGKLRAAERVDLAFTGAKREAQVLERARSMN